MQDFKDFKQDPDFQDFTKEDFEAMAEAEAAHDALMNAVPDYDEEAARDADDVRREAEHETSVEKGDFKPWFLRDETETENAHSAEHEHDR